MATSPRQCPKCNHEMNRGFVIDNTESGGRKVAHWAAGGPRKSFWLGTKLPDEELVPIGAYRCTSCGYLELYARQDFAAQ
jgi:hypothetical protein